MLISGEGSDQWCSGFYNYGKSLLSSGSAQFHFHAGFTSTENLLELFTVSKSILFGDSEFPHILSCFHWLVQVFPKRDQ